MNNIELYSLLDKKALSSEDKLLLDKLLSEDPEAEKNAQIYKSVKRISEKGSHLDSNILGEYTLFKNNLNDGNNLFLKLAPKVENHLRECEQCRNNFTMMNEELTFVDNFVSNNLKEKKSIFNLQKTTNTSWWYSKESTILKKAIYSIAALFLVYFSIYSYYKITTPEYKKGLVVFQGDEKFIARGRVSSEFQKGIAELDKGYFENAIDDLNSDIKDNSNDKTIFYTHFILGKTYLLAAKKNVLGLYDSYDKLKLEKSIQAFEKTIDKNKNPVFNHLNYDAYYYIARDLLLLERFDEAKKYLRIVIDKKGRFKFEAENLLKYAER